MLPRAACGRPLRRIGFPLSKRRLEEPSCRQEVIDSSQIISQNKNPAIQLVVCNNSVVIKTEPVETKMSSGLESIDCVSIES